MFKEKAVDIKHGDVGQELSERCDRKIGQLWKTVSQNILKLFIHTAVSHL